jgi:flagellar biosynthetic protein FliR
MELVNIPIDRFQAFLVCAARVASLISSMPIFSGGQTPMKMRLGVALTLALVVFPVVEPLLPAVDFSPVGLGLLMVQEVILGLMLGFVAQLVFTAVEFGGTVVGYQMGFAAANVFDPQNQRQISLMSQFQNVLAILIFLSLDIHHLFLRVLVQSYDILPPGKLDMSGEAVPYLMALAGNMFVLGIKFSAPVLAVLLLSGLVLGILSRVFPQLNVFMLSFPLNIGLAFLTIGLTLGLMTTLLSREFNLLGEKFLTLISLL